MSDKINALDNFVTEYKLFNEGDKKSFSKIVGKLLSETFIVKEKDSDRVDFLFAREYSVAFSAYFEIIDYEFVYDRYNELCYIKTTENRNRIRLNKFDTALILIFRQFYYLKRKEVVSENKVMVQLEEVIDKIRTSKIFKDDKKVNSYKDTLYKLRVYKIIDFSATMITENLTIQIFPSIQVIIQQDNIEDITARLLALKKNGEDTGDEFDEDTDED